ncbi:MAG: helix-turn-helix transcriptional regulator [Deltaproteobacteria bacterium]|nr:helix-turn-helix transcriptional regulator [Deltaproteobacteria bacterium]
MSIYNDFYRNLASTIRFHRKKSGLSQQELARLAGIGKTAVFDMEHAKTTIQMDTFIKILNVLNIKMELRSPLLKPERNEE